MICQPQGSVPFPQGTHHCAGGRRQCRIRNLPDTSIFFPEQEMNHNKFGTTCFPPRVDFPCFECLPGMIIHHNLVHYESSVSLFSQLFKGTPCHLYASECYFATHTVSQCAFYIFVQD